MMKVFLFLVPLIFTWLKPEAQAFRQEFRAAWQFRKAGGGPWHRAEVPGTVHTDLLANGLIPDPFYGDNETKVQWVEKEDWEYRAVFTPPASVWATKKTELVFDGLDTYADVYLNGKLLLRADNMFRQWRAEAGALLHKSTNELRIIFHSAARHDDSLSSLSAVKLAGENNRMYSRKAQYQYGWDWGPRLVTCGIWKSIRWEAGEEPAEKSSGKIKRWNVKLITRTDSIGESFYFTVDGSPVFMKGANWIPCESFLPRAKKLQRYEKLLRAAKEARINMLRVWGGGIYEDDLFYDLCDKYKILVWQDFMFAGALYPGDPAFLKNVEEEIRYQVTRLRRHPCIALWCGNNEIEEAWYNWGWQQQFHYSSADSVKLWNDYRQIFHRLIPGILQELDPQRPYWPSSPSIGWGREQAYRRGDVHYWGVWWGKEPVEKYESKTGRFHSEYGMQGFPDMATIRSFSNEKDWDTASAVMRMHQKHPFGYPNIKYYIENKFRAPGNFKDLVYLSQLMQADAIRTAIEAHRRNMPVTMGTLFWQWNDCWPVVSWSAVDYYARKKALYFQVKRSFAPQLLSVPVTDSSELSLYFISETDLPGKLELKAEAFDFSGKSRSVQQSPYFFTVKKGIPVRLEYPRGFIHPRDQENVYWMFTVTAGGKVIAGTEYFFLPPKDLLLQHPRISWQLVNGNSLVLQTDKFAYGVQLELPDGLELSDNYFHLSPGNPKTIRLSGKFTAAYLKDHLKIKSLADTF